MPVNTAQYDDPTANILKVAVDELNKAMGAYIVAPSEDKMAAAKIARMVVHGGIDKIVSQRDALLKENREMHSLLRVQASMEETNEAMKDTL